MCGIIGYTGAEKAVPKLLEGLTALEYRGYDSAGIAFFERGELKTRKSKGRIEVLKSKAGALCDKAEICCGIGHTRWATHGEPSDRNSHPHGTDRVYIVHNGIIENYAKIKEELLKKGYTFESETDTETAAKLLDSLYEGDPVAAIRKAQELLEGSYAIAAVFRDFENLVYAFRKDNPLLLAPSDNGNFVASDASAVLKYTRKIRRLEEGEIALVDREKITVLGTDNKVLEAEFCEVSWNAETASMKDFPHYMLKEIFEEPQVIEKTVKENLVDGLPCFLSEELSAERLKAFERIHIVACGTAMHAGLIGKIAIERMARVPVMVTLASEFRYQDPVLDKKDMVIVISQSGETADTVAALRLANERGVYTLGIVNVEGSTVAEEAHSVLFTRAGTEIAVASTKAYSAQLAVLYLFAIKLAFALEKLDESEVRSLCSELVNEIPSAIEKALESRSHCLEIAKKYKDNRSIFFIGRGQDYALCCEASLKMKEISYIHCESYAAGELKHGTISLVTKGVPVFAFATESGIFEKTVSNIKETVARGARVVIFCREDFTLPEGVAEDVLTVPKVSELFMPIVTAALAQLVAYYTSAELGLDVDKPRNLAKSVTVE